MFLGLFVTFGFAVFLANHQFKAQPNTIISVPVSVQKPVPNLVENMTQLLGAIADLNGRINKTKRLIRESQTLDLKAQYRRELYVMKEECIATVRIYNTYKGHTLPKPRFPQTVDITYCD